MTSSERQCLNMQLQGKTGKFKQIMGQDKLPGGRYPHYDLWQQHQRGHTRRKRVRQAGRGSPGSARQGPLHSWAAVVDVHPAEPAEAIKKHHGL